MAQMWAGYWVAAKAAWRDNKKVVSMVGLLEFDLVAYLGWKLVVWMVASRAELTVVDLVGMKVVWKDVKTADLRVEYSVEHSVELSAALMED